MVFGLQKLQNDLFCMTEERNYFQGKYMEQISEIAALKDELSKARREILRLRGELMESSSTALGLDSLSISQQQQQSQSQQPPSLDITSENMYQTPQKKGRRRSRRKFQEEKKDGDINPGAGTDDTEDEDASDGEEGIISSEEDGPGEDGHLNNNNQHTLTSGANLDNILYNDDDEEDHEDINDEDTEAADIRQSAEKLLQWASYRTYTRSSMSAANSPDQVSLASGAGGAVVGNNQSIMVPRTIESNSATSGSHEGGDAGAGTDNPSSGGISPTLSHDSGATQPTNNSGSRDEEEEEAAEVNSTDVAP